MIKIIAVILALVLFVPTIVVMGYKTVANVCQGNDFGTAIGMAWNDWVDTIVGLFGSEAKADTLETHIFDAVAYASR